MASENIRNIRNVTYKNLGWDSSTDIYLPPDLDEAKKYPAIVSTHAIGSCKEQTAGNIYAAALAKEGFVVIALLIAFGSARELLLDRQDRAGQSPLDGNIERRIQPAIPRIDLKRFLRFRFRAKTLQGQEQPWPLKLTSRRIPSYSTNNTRSGAFASFQKNQPRCAVCRVALAMPTSQYGSAGIPKCPADVWHGEPGSTFKTVTADEME